MITPTELADAIRRAALAELGPEALGLACVPLSAIVVRLFGELLGERLQLATDGRHTWAVDGAGAVYDVQPNPILVGARPAGYRAAPLDPFQVHIFAELAEGFAPLRHSPHIPRADEVAGRIFRAALVEIARQADGATLARLIDAGHGRLVELARPELLRRARELLAARVLAPAGRDESARPWNEIWL